MFWDINILSYSSMFYGCENILEADLTQINITSATNFKNMFSDCKSLKKVKLFKINSNEDNYNINLNYMLSNCSSLNFVNISDIQLNGKNNDLNMYYTFKGCISLNSVSIFNILLNGYGNRGDMRDIFGDCPSLKSVNIFNIELNGYSSDIDMRSLFNGCNSLSHVNLYKIELNGYASDIDMRSMFSGCSNISLVNIYNIQLNGYASDIDMRSMFWSCSNISLVNLYNIQFREYATRIDMRSMFKYCSFYNLINISNITLKDTNDDLYMNNMFYKCSFFDTAIMLNIEAIGSGHRINMDNMFSNCISFNLSFNYNINININKGYISMNNTFNNFKNLTFAKLSNINIINNNGNIISDNMFKDCFSLISVDFSNVKLLGMNSTLTMNYIFSGCKNLRFINFTNFQESDNSRFTNMFDNIPENIVYCLNEKSLLYSLFSQKNCSLLDCTDNWQENQKKKIIFNSNICVDNCDDYPLYDYNNMCYSITDKNCPKEFNFISTSSNECVINCNYPDILNKKCISINSNNTINLNNTNNIQEILLETLKNEINNKNIISKIDTGNDSIVEYEGIKFTLTTTQNQKNNIKKNNMTIINLGECENKLMKEYKITGNIYIIKIDKEIKGMKVPKIEYEVYAASNNNSKLELLNLSICEGLKVGIYIPTNISKDQYDKYDIKNGFYSNICYTYATEDGIDISLTDRKKEFIENNMTLCEENCDLERYDFQIEKAICSCNIKIKFPLISEINFDKNKLIDKFKDIKQVSNINIIK